MNLRNMTVKAGTFVLLVNFLFNFTCMFKFKFKDIRLEKLQSNLFDGNQSESREEKEVEIDCTILQVID